MGNELRPRAGRQCASRLTGMTGDFFAQASGTSGPSGFHAVVDAHRAAEKIDDADVAAAEALHRGGHAALCGVTLERLGCRDVRIVNLLGGAMSINNCVKA